MTTNGSGSGSGSTCKRKRSSRSERKRRSRGRERTPPHSTPAAPLARRATGVLLPSALERGM